MGFQKTSAGVNCFGERGRNGGLQKLFPWKDWEVGYEGRVGFFPRGIPKGEAGKLNPNFYPISYPVPRNPGWPRI